MLRKSFTEKIQSLFDAQESALALGYLVGDKTNMTDEMVNALRAAGLSHMIVTSGYHLSIIIELTKKWFGKVSRAMIVLSAFSVILFLISITGMSASILRAGLMSFLSLSFWHFGRKFHPGRLLLYVAAASLLFSPNYITSSAWLLSFAAYFGITFFSPVLTKYLYGDAKPNFITSSIIVSFSAQLFCLPISIFNFGMVSIVGILAGLLVTPTVPVVMVLTLISAIAPFIKYPTRLFINLHLFIVANISKIPWAVAKISANNWLIFLIYIPIFGAFFALKRLTHYDFHPRYALDKIPKYGKIYPC